jgi:MYXO-CTERM domain-containing protein
MGGATSSREGLIVFLIAGVGLVLRRRRSTRQ